MNLKAIKDSLYWDNGKLAYQQNTGNNNEQRSIGANIR